MKVTLKMSAKKVVTIQAVGPKVAAVVKKVDAAKQTVSLQIDDTNMVAEGHHGCAERRGAFRR